MHRLSTATSASGFGAGSLMSRKRRIQNDTQGTRVGPTDLPRPHRRPQPLGTGSAALPLQGGEDGETDPAAAGRCADTESDPSHGQGSHSSPENSRRGNAPVRSRLIPHEYGYGFARFDALRGK